MRAVLSLGGEAFEVELLETPTAKAVAEILPLETSFQTWGDEFYFPVPMDPRPLEKGAGVKMEVGDLAYWPEGNALAVFFGPTPASTGAQPVAFSSVNRIGKLQGDASRLRPLAASPTLRMELLPEAAS